MLGLDFDAMGSWSLWVEVQALGFGDLRIDASGKPILNSGS